MSNSNKSETRNLTPGKATMPLDKTPDGKVLRMTTRTLVKARKIAKIAKDASAPDFLAQRLNDSGE
jgi:hypothetical protein